MKILTALLLFPLLTAGQNIVYDKTDPFTGRRTVITELMPVYSVAKIPVASMLAMVEIDSAGRKYRLGISSKDLQLKSVSSDQVNPECKLMMWDRAVITGTWQETAKVKGEQISYFTFSESDLAKARGKEVTHVKMIGKDGHHMEFEVPEKGQKVISGLCKKILDF